MNRLARALKRSLQSIDSLYLEAIAPEKSSCTRKKGETTDLMQFGFRREEAASWVHNEPDFTKRIVKPLDRKRRDNAPIVAMLFLLLAIQHYSIQVNAMQVSSPNGLLQAQKIHVPNDKLTLPSIG